jgi:putative peptidoglycan lipid II flippase
MGLARSAGLLSLGSGASRVLGVAREMVIAAFFGATGEVSAFRIANQVPVLIYDFLVGGMMSAALVPVLSEYAYERRSEFARLVGVLFGLFGLGLGLLVVALEIAAPRLAWLLAAGFRQSDPALLPLTVRLIQLAAPAVWILSIAGLCTAVLFSLQRFSFPAAATAVYNLGIIVAAPLLASTLGIVSLVVGVLIGATAQMALLLYDLRRAGVWPRPRLELRHPAVRKMLRLYAPIAAGLVVSLFQVGLDRRLASGTVEQAIAWMSNATTLQQMPLGLISVAIASASLPKLSSFYAQSNEAAYRVTLARGLRLVLIMIAPAAVGLALLGEPVVRLLFERRLFTPADTVQVAQALQIYVVGMVFAAVDFPLNFAFYARNNTLLPALVGVLSVGVYVLVALALVGPMGYLGLVWADTAKQASHALVVGGLLRYKTGPLSGRLGHTVLATAVGAGCMAGVIWLVSQAVPVFGGGAGRDLVLLATAGGAGLAVYTLVLSWLGMQEVKEVAVLLRRRLLR